MKRWVLLAGIAVLLIILIGLGIIRGRASSDSTSDERSDSSVGQSLEEQSIQEPTAAEILKSVQYYRCNDNRDGSEPRSILIQTRQELSEIETQHQDTWPAQYYDSFFTDNDLLLIMLWERSGAIRHKVEDVRLEDGKILIGITSITKYEMTDDAVMWDIALQCAKGSLPEGEIEIHWTERQLND